ncbi:MAG: hypothetical protein JW801_12640, partial [Bacteroidales bacterium]|nr:hypothetical protein [Bacteroidales bacterium]
KLAIGNWRAENTKEEIQIRAHMTGGLDIPMGDIKQILDSEGKDAEVKIIASTNDTYIMGDGMNLHPFWVQVLGQDKIRLTHKETGIATVYNRINLP